MGNCCSSSSDNFQGEGRTLGSAPVNASARPPTTGSASVPTKRASAPPPGRTLGSATSQEPSSAKAAAARAAEERAKQSSAQNKGRLSQKLEAQKAKTQNETLAESARENKAARDADAAARQRNWD